MSAPRKRSAAELSRLLKAWLTLGLASFSMLLFLATRLVGVDADAARAAALERSSAFWAAHPFLDAPAEVVAAADAAVLEGATFSADDAKMIPSARLERQQAELAELVAGIEVAERSGTAYRFAFDARAPRPLGLAAHVFVHLGALQLLWNLALLLAAGPRLEAALGRALFGLVFAGAALAGAVAHVVSAGAESAPLLGSFAATAGLCAALALHTSSSARDPFAEPSAALPKLSASTAAWLAAAFAVALVGAALGGGIAASVGGFAFGGLAALGLARAGLIRDTSAMPLSPEIAEALAAVRAGDAAGAAERLRAQLEVSADDALLGRAYAHALRAGDDPARANVRVVEALFSAVERRRRETAKTFWRELAAAGVAPAGRADLLITLASWLRSAREPREARLAFQLALRDADAASSAKLARDVRRSDPLTALAAAERALALGTLDEPERSALRALAQQARTATGASGAALDAELAARFARTVEAELRAPLAPAVSEMPELARSAAVDESRFGDEAVAPHGAAHFTEPELTLGESPSPEPEPGDGGFFDRDAIDLSAEQPAVELPDPEVAGDAALLDALHEALTNDGADLAAELAEPSQPAAARAPEPEPALPPPAAATSDAFAFGAAGETSDGLDFGIEFEEKLAPAPRPLRPLRISAARPLLLADDALVLEIEGRGKGKLAWSKIDAVAAVGVSGLSQSGKAVLMIDLALGFTKGEGELRIVRLRADAFDPRSLVAGQPSPLGALRALVAELRRRARAVALPEEAGASAPFRIFPDLASYQREVLGGEALRDEA